MTTLCATPYKLAQHDCLDHRKYARDTITHNPKQECSAGNLSLTAAQQQPPGLQRQQDAGDTCSCYNAADTTHSPTGMGSFKHASHAVSLYKSLNRLAASSEHAYAAGSY
jgi:hypothetical protein